MFVSLLDDERIFAGIEVIWHSLDLYLVDLDLSSKLMLRIALSDELPHTILHALALSLVPGASPFRWLA